MCEDELPMSRLSKVIVLQPANACISLCVVTSGQVTKMAVTPHDLPYPKTPCCSLHANVMTLCFIEPELLPIEVLHCETRDFGLFLLL